MATSVCLTNGGERRHWWLTNRKVADKYVREARSLIASQDRNDVASAIGLLDAALAISPRSEVALELKARSLLYLRRFKDVADMLQDCIPSLKMANDDSSDNSSTQLSRERVKLLSPSKSSSSDSSSGDSVFKCFSVTDLKKRFMAGLCKSCQREGQWRYMVLGQACSHLGLMEDAMVLLQTGKRLATAAFRRQSVSWSDDNFALFSDSAVSTGSPSDMSPRSLTESETVAHLLSHIKFLLRRRTAAIAALDAGLFTESVRHFSKIIDGRRPAPPAFLADCYMHRAAAYRSAGRIAESISDCNKTLALDPSCIQALETRALLLETIRCLPDSLHDLEHLKLLYNTILRDRKLPGPPWKRHNVSYREIPGKLCVLTTKMQQLKQRVANGETRNVDHYSLMGIRRGCSRSELERAYMLLCLRHKPDKAMGFIDRCDFGDENDVDSVKDRAKMSTLLLFRLIQKGYSTVMAHVIEEEEAEKQRKKAATALQAAQAAIQVQQTQRAAPGSTNESSSPKASEISSSNRINSSEKNAFQGIFCRDIATVGNLLSRAGFNHAMAVAYEALSC